MRTVYASSKKRSFTSSFFLRFLRSPIRTMREEKTVFKFMIVGASGTGVNVAVLYLLHGIIGLVLAQAFGIEISIVNNFIWNDSFTFRYTTTESEGRKIGRLYRFVKYNVLSLGTAALNLAVFYLLTFPLGLRQGYLYLGSSLLAVLVAFVFNYFGSSRWAWSQPSKQTGATRTESESGK